MEVNSFEAVPALSLTEYVELDLFEDIVGAYGIQAVVVAAVAAAEQPRRMVPAQSVVAAEDNLVATTAVVGIVVLSNTQNLPQR